MVTVNSHIVSYPTPILSTNALSEGWGTDSMLQYLCRNINDLAFSGPGNSLNMDDYHAWCIDKQGVVHDYDPKIIMSNVNFGTTDIVRVPFTGDISEKLVHCDKTYNAYLQGMITEFGGDIKDAKKTLLSLIHTPLFPQKHCCTALSKLSAFACNVGRTVVTLPRLPFFSGPREGFPFVGGARKVFGSKDRRQRNGQELVVRHWEAGMGEFTLSLLKHINVLGDALRCRVVTEHVCWKVYKLTGMEAAEVCVEVGHELASHDVGVE